MVNLTESYDKKEKFIRMLPFPRSLSVKDPSLTMLAASARRKHRNSGEGEDACTIVPYIVSVHQRTHSTKGHTELEQIEVLSN